MLLFLTSKLHGPLLYKNPLIRGIANTVISEAFIASLPKFIQSDGTLRVIMNMFKMSFLDFITAVKD